MYSLHEPEDKEVIKYIMTCKTYCSICSICVDDCPSNLKMLNSRERNLCRSMLRNLHHLFFLFGMTFVQLLTRYVI